MNATRSGRTAFRLLGAAALVLLAACRSDAPGPTMASASPASGVPVGPLPGPVATYPQDTNPYHGDPVAIAEGRRLFVRFNCSGCHGGHAGGGMGPSLRDPDWTYGSSAARIRDSIAEGRAHGMPAWGPVLPDDYLWKLTAYIQTLGTAEEAAPPR